MNCPNCGVILLQGMKTCPKCKYDLNLKKVLSDEDKKLIDKYKSGAIDVKCTTGNSFEGYKITDYKDVIFDEIIFGMGFANSIAASFDNVGSALTGSEATIMTDKLNEVKSDLKNRAKMKALGLGGNAIIGIDFESSSFSNSMLMVSISGTVVTIEKID